MDKKSNQLSHDEIWDDSALVDSWNEALEEYKKYHSIHAKGGTLKDLNQLVHDGSAQSNIQGHDTGDQPDETESGQESSTGGGANKAGQVREIPSLMTLPATKLCESLWFHASRWITVHQDLKTESTEQRQPPPNAIPGPFPPQVVMGSVRDENLKKLLMSWYYAGYYTGLYEGQQQADQQAQQKDS
ncbi:Survival motor neuron-like protein 1 [Paramyrothecium foliicola]|nr:Survival motor neuron-like protein 1 [Paramyrothecium foliicola]